jgi:hypothetical protein
MVSQRIVDGLGDVHTIGGHVTDRSDGGKVVESHQFVDALFVFQLSKKPGPHVPGRPGNGD